MVNKQRLRGWVSWLFLLCICIFVLVHQRAHRLRSADSVSFSFLPSSLQHKSYFLKHTVAAKSVDWSLLFLPGQAVKG